MGNSVSRPSCLGEKSPRPEDFQKDPCSAAQNEEEEEEEEGAGSSEKACLSPRVTENGWNAALPKQTNLHIQLQNCCPLPTQLERALAPQASPKSLGANWVWKLPTTREVTEVTEVTETVVTEIVEVTEFPGGDTSREALVTRMVLADVREALPQAATLPGDVQGAGLTPETAGKLGAWVSEVEDLMGHQRPPSGEAKVVKAQLQEQKLLLRLLEERTPHIGRLGQPLSAEPASAAKGQEQPRGLASLQETWAALVQEAEARHHCLQQIVPAASVFQESVEAFQDWLSLTEQKLAQLWGAPGSLAQSQDALQQIQARCRESFKEAQRGRGRIREREGPRGLLESPGCLLSSRICARKFSRSQQNWKRPWNVDGGSCRWCQASNSTRCLQEVELSHPGGHLEWLGGMREGRRVAEGSEAASLQPSPFQGSKAIPHPEGEEGQLVQGKVDSLRLRLLLVDQRSSDALQRMEQTLEASPRLDPAQEDPTLGLQPPEKEQHLPGSQAGDGPSPLAPAGREKGRLWAAQGKECPIPTLSVGEKGSLPGAETGKDRKAEASGCCFCCSCHHQPPPLWSGLSPWPLWGSSVLCSGEADESGLLPPISAGEQRLRPQLAAASQLSPVALNLQAICPEQKVALAKDQPAMGAIRFDLPSFSVLPLGCCGVTLGGRTWPTSPYGTWLTLPALTLVSSQPLVVARQEDTESLGCQSPACTLQLAQGQLLLAQHAEVQAELRHWLEEAQQVVAAFSSGSVIIGCDAFQEQQEALEVRALAGGTGGA
ncbi:hypothetical protein E2320_011837 [Naja naja]|nr:hypothetical protein E2320_011837 [Naja naja]